LNYRGNSDFYFNAYIAFESVFNSLLNTVLADFLIK